MDIRKPFAALCASLLAVTLLSFGLSWSAWHVVGQPDYIKQTLRESGIYNTIVGDVLQQKQADIAAAAGVSADSRAARDVAAQALSPSLIQDQTEQVIDNSFDWLQGKTDRLDTAFNLDSIKQQLADGVANYTEKQLRALPACTSADLQHLNRNTPSNPLEANCLPYGFDIPAAVAQARANVLNSQALEDTPLDAAQSEAGTSTALQERLQGGQTMYERLQWAVCGQGILAALLALGLVFLSTEWRAGMRRVGMITLWTGAVSAGLAWASNYVVQFAADRLLGSLDAQVIQQKLIGIAQLVVGDIRTWWLWYGIALAVLGIILLGVYRLIRPTPAKVATALAREEGVTVTERSSDSVAVASAPGEPDRKEAPSPPGKPAKPRTVQ